MGEKLKKKEVILLGLICLLGLGLRVVGVGYGLPHSYRPDEEYFYNIVLSMDRGEMNPHLFLYPSFFMYLSLIVWRIYVLVQLFAGNFEVSKGVQVLLNQHPGIVYLLGRLLSVAFGALTVPVVYLIGRRHYSMWAGLLAAFYLAINPVHTLNVHFFKSHAAAGFFIPLAFLFILDYLETGKWHHYLLAAGISGLAFSCNYYGGFLGLPLVMVLFFRARREGHTLLWPFASWPLYIGLSFMVLVFMVTSPYIFLDFYGFLKHFELVRGGYLTALFNDRLRLGLTEYGVRQPPIYFLLFGLRHSMGIGLSLAVILGTILMVIRARSKDLVMIIFVLFFSFWIIRGKAIYLRYFIGTAPFLCLIAAVSVLWVLERLNERSTPLACLVFPVIFLVTSVGPFYVSWQQNRLLTKKDTRTIAEEWFAKNVPPGSAIAADLSWRYGKPPLPRGMRYVNLSSNLRSLETQGVGYVMIDQYYLKIFSPELKSSVKGALERQATLVKHIQPVTDPEAQPLFDHYDAFYVPMARFGGIERPGPEIKIYRLQSGEEKREPKPAERSRSGLLGKYYTTVDFSGSPRTRIDRQLNFDWDTGGPMSEMPVDNFSVLWEGELYCPTQGMYSFYLFSDDGSRLWIDDELVVDNWKEQAATEKEGTRMLETGWHRIRVAFFDGQFGARLKLSWSYPGRSKIIIPPGNLRTAESP